MTREDSNRLAPRSPWQDPWLWAVFAAAFVLRLLYLIDLCETPFFRYPQMDALYHDEWARRLAAGDWWGSEVYFRAPLYPYFLGLWYAIAGTDPVAIRIVQLGIGAGTAVLTAALSIGRIGRLGGIVAGFLVAFHGPSIFYEGELLLVVLEAPLFLLSAWSLDRAVTGRSPRGWVLAGACVGLAALVRPTILALLPVVAAYLLLRRRRRGMGPAALYAASAILVLSPVLVRNAIVGKDFVPVASQGGLNYYLGNHAGADGMAALAPEFRKTWSGGIEDARRLAEQAEGRALKPSEISSYWFGRAIAWARQDPGAFLSLQLRKLAYFWDAFEIPNNEDLGFFSRLTRIFRSHALSGFWLLGPLAIAGLVLGWRRGTLSFAWIAVPATLTLVMAAFFVCGRFRAGLVPLLAVWAGAGIGGLAPFRAQQGSRWLYVLVLLGAALFVNADPWGHRRAHGPSESYLRLGIHYARLGDLDRAVSMYENAVTANPAFADGWNNLGVARAERGERDLAEAAFRRAVALDPRHAKALGNLAKLLFDAGRLGEADSLARACLEAASGEPVALRTSGTVLGNLGVARGDPERVGLALEAFQKLALVESGSPDAALGQARALLFLGRRDEAHAILLALPEERRTEEVRRLLEGTGP